MNDWSLASEYFAFILLAVIALFFYDVKAPRGFRKLRLAYWRSLIFSALSVALNIATVVAIENINGGSTLLAKALNTLYFFVSWIMITVMVYYIFLRLLEFVYDKRYIRSVRITLGVIFALFTFLLLFNIPTGIIFSFDNSGSYCRGPLNAVGFVMPALEVVLLIACYFRHRKSISKDTEKIIFVAAPIALLLILFQVAYPDQLLNGAICALVNLIIFISYRGGRGEQDPVTGLDNPHCFMTELMYRTASKQDYQIILVKIKSLTRINRVYGFKGGTSLLFQLGEAFRGMLGEDKAFRYGNDEIALLFTGSGEEACAQRLNGVTEIMRRRWKLGINETTLAFYIVEFRYNGQDWSSEDIYGYLNDASHKASRDNLECVAFDESLIGSHQRRDYLLRTMHSALEENRFDVWYQPVYYRSSGKFESAEALLRMVDENGESVSPGEFIPVAEETGIIDKLSVLVLENICRLLRDGGIEDLKSISINIPIRQITETWLKERFRAIIDKYGIRPNQIRLEITERDLEQNGYMATQAIRDLREAGYSFMLDDFGVGYSNLSRVLSMPFDTIKVDRSLVLLLEQDDMHFSVMKDHVIPLFGELGQSVVAEGVETEALANLVYECGIDRIQGFYYATPMSEKALIEWYSRH